MSEERKFKSGAHRSLVKRTAIRMGIRNTELMVLNEMLSVINHQSGQTRISRDRICEKIGRTLKPVKQALSSLRKRGVIYPVAYPNGGYGRCTVYCFRYSEDAVIEYNSKKPTGAKFTPLNTGDILNNGGKKCHLGGYILPTTGVNSTPPSNISNISIERGASADKDAPRRGGGDKVDEVRAEEIRLFGRECTEYGYEGARRREDARKATAAE